MNARVSILIAVKETVTTDIL